MVYYKAVFTDCYDAQGPAQSFYSQPAKPATQRGVGKVGDLTVEKKSLI